MGNGSGPASGSDDDGGSESDRSRSAAYSTSSGSIHRVIRWGSILVIVGALLVTFRALPLDQAMSALKSWIEGLGVWGPVVLVLLYIVATVLFVPGTILTLAAGAIFGLSVGTVIVSIGSTVGASLAFLIARYAARDRVAQLAQRNRHFGAIDRAVDEGGWKIVGLLRLSPAVPFNLQNYLYGLTPVAFWPYVLTSWAAMLPATFLYVYLGHITGVAIGADRERTSAEWGLLAVGLLATVVVTVYVTRLANAKLKEQVDAPESAEGDGRPDVETEDADASAPPKMSKTVLLAFMALIAIEGATYVRSHEDGLSTSLANWLGTSSAAPTDIARPTNPTHPTSPEDSP
ncbi:TVP38/TMEM64 family protein [Rhodopirellula sallentina]|nr:TVP38/TMEM64 family protein [Rhodopirellula sallentina]